MTESYEVVGKGIKTTLHTSQARIYFWLLPGAVVSAHEAKGFSLYRQKAWQLRQDALKKGMLVDVGDVLLVTETLVFDSIASAVSFILGNSRSGDVAQRGKRSLTGSNM